METNPPLPPSKLVLALALGAVPALAAGVWKPELFQRWDLSLAAAVMAGAIFLSRRRRAAQTLWPPLALGLALLVLVVPTLTVHWANKVPVTNDEGSYLYQAELFAAGEVTEGIQVHEWVDFSLRRRQVMDDRELKRRYSKYPPGTAMALTPGVLLGWPPLMVALAGVLDLVLIWRLALLMKLPRPKIAALLLAISPFFLLVQSSFQSEVFTLPAALAGYLALMLARRHPERCFALTLGIGACAGWIFLCRPLTGVIFAVAMVPGLIFRGRALGSDPEPSRAPALKGLIGAVLGGLPFLIIGLAYNRALTGDWWTAPYEVYAKEFGPWQNPGADFADRIPIDVYGTGDLLPGLWRQFARWSVAFAGMLGAVALAIWGLWRNRRTDGGSALAFTILLPLAYAAHWYPGHWAYLGPLYCFESLGFLVLGFLLLLKDAPEAWRKNFVLAALAWGGVVFAIRLQPMNEQAYQRSIPVRVAETMPDESVLLLPHLDNQQMHERTLKEWTPSHNPFDQRVAIIRELPEPDLTLRVLMALKLDQRSVFRLSPVPNPSTDQLPYEAIKVEFDPLKE
jgi:hypothetical protein